MESSKRFRQLLRDFGNFVPEILANIMRFRQLFRYFGNFMLTIVKIKRTIVFVKWTFSYMRQAISSFTLPIVYLVKEIVNIEWTIVYLV